MPQLTRSEFHELYEQGEEVLFELFSALYDEISALRAEVNQLKDQVSKNSSNSSKPPSSDIKKKKRTQSLRVSSGKKPGGQPGHQGHTLKFVQPPDHVHSYSHEWCSHCAASLKGVSVHGYEKRQVFDLPPLQLEVSEHQSEIKRCPHCQLFSKASFPQEVTHPTQYGPALKGLCSYFNIYHFIPFDRTHEIIEDLFEHSISPASVMQANETLSHSLEPFEQVVKTQLIKSKVVHFDESGLRVNSKGHWLHVASTPFLTHYSVDPKRGGEAMENNGILPHFEGTAIHDHWKSYFTYEQCAHGLCNAHHLREFLFIHQRYQQDWAKEMSQLLLEIKETVEQTGDEFNSLPPGQLRDFEQRYDTLVKKGLEINPPPPKPLKKKPGPIKQSPPKNLLDRLSTYKKEVLAFMYNFDIPFDNNQAERDVRMIKVKQKVSGSFRTQKGADDFCRIRGYISTIRKNSFNVIEAIRSAIDGKPIIPHNST